MAELAREATTTAQQLPFRDKRATDAGARRDMHEVPADRAVPQFGERAEVRLVVHLDEQRAQRLGKQRPKLGCDVDLTPAKVRGVRHDSGLSHQARHGDCEARRFEPVAGRLRQRHPCEFGQRPQRLPRLPAAPRRRPADLHPDLLPEVDDARSEVLDPDLQAKPAGPAVADGERRARPADSALKAHPALTQETGLDQVADQAAHGRPGQAGRLGQLGAGGRSEAGDRAEYQRQVRPPHPLLGCGAVGLPVSAWCAAHANSPSWGSAVRI